jgi:ubiquinone/menaquinone biosynthesis C-methylase UbiE
MQEIKNDAKKDIEQFYEKQSAEKTSDLNSWLNSGSVRIPEPALYYYFEDRKISSALKMANLRRNAKILEIGCNLGQMTFVLHKKGFRIIGTDISPNAIEKARLRMKHFQLSDISFEVQDAENMAGHDEGEFDGVFSFSAFRYMPNPEKALKECFRLLKSKGCAVIDFPNKYCPWFLLLKPIAFALHKPALYEKRHIHDHVFSAHQVKNMMERAGFVDISICQFLFTFKALPGFLLPVMKPVDFILEHIPFIQKTAAIIMAKGIKP